MDIQLLWLSVQASKQARITMHLYSVFSLVWGLLRLASNTATQHLTRVWYLDHCWVAIITSSKWWLHLLHVGSLNNWIIYRNFVAHLSSYSIAPHIPSTFKDLAQTVVSKPTTSGLCKRTLQLHVYNYSTVQLSSLGDAPCVQRATHSCTEAVLTSSWWCKSMQSS